MVGGQSEFGVVPASLNVSGLAGSRTPHLHYRHMWRICRSGKSEAAHFCYNRSVRKILSDLGQSVIRSVKTITFSNP